MANRTILKSIWGRLVGLTHEYFLTGDKFQGVVVGIDGQDYPLPVPGTQGSGSKCDIFDDFVGKAINTFLWDLLKGSDGGCANFAVLAGLGGTIQGSTGAGAGATMAVNGLQIDAALNWQANKGGILYAEFGKVLPSAVSQLSIFIGLTNETGTLQMPATQTTTTVTANANDCVGFLYDSAATTKTWYLVSCFGGGTPQKVAISNAPDGTTAHTYRVEVDASGNARFFIDGKQVGAIIAGTNYSIAAAVTPTVPLSPVLACFAHSAASITVTADWIWAQNNH